MLIKKSKIGLFFLSLTLIAVSSAVLGDAQHLYSDSSFKPASSLVEFELSDDNKPFDNVDDFLSTHVYHNKKHATHRNRSHPVYFSAHNVAGKFSIRAPPSFIG